VPEVNVQARRKFRPGGVHFYPRSPALRAAACQKLQGEARIADRVLTEDILQVTDPRFVNTRTQSAFTCTGLVSECSTGLCEWSTGLCQCSLCRFCSGPPLVQTYFRPQVPV